MRHDHHHLRLSWTLLLLLFVLATLWPNAPHAAVAAAPTTAAGLSGGTTAAANPNTPNNNNNHTGADALRSSLTTATPNDHAANNTSAFCLLCGFDFGHLVDGVDDRVAGAALVGAGALLVGAVCFCLGCCCCGGQRGAGKRRYASVRRKEEEDDEEEEDG